MGFASTYLEKRALFPQKILEVPHCDTGIIVVVPAYNEPEIKKLLDSLAKCTAPECQTEVIVVVNAPGNATMEGIVNNAKTLLNIESWKKENRSCFFRLSAFSVGQPLIRRWGVGLARKTGMDEAIRRFNCIDRPDGVIVNLDADCTVEKNYFLALSNGLLMNNRHSACSIYFEHPLSGTGFPDTIYKHVALYELHLRYFLQGLAYSGFPYVFHTVGSATAVKAMAYTKTGGMNRRQAGEDFYFIQKILTLGGYFSLNSTTVYPSPRFSSRVPFGTGASVEKLSSVNSSTFLTYNVLAFIELRTFFDSTDDLFTCAPGKLYSYFYQLPAGLKSFLDENEWTDKIMEIKNNTSEIKTFRKRFFEWFNMFRIVKYLNYVHLDFFEKKPVEISASEMLKMLGNRLISEDLLGLLHFYRQLEKHSAIS